MSKPDFGAEQAPRLLSILRIVTGYIFLLHGTAKLLGVPHVAMFDGLRLVSFAGSAGVLELTGGALMIMGLWTRATAFVLSGEMAIAYFMAHAPRGLPIAPLVNGGDAAVLFCFVFLYFAAAGAGPWSIDASMRPTGTRSQ